MVAFLYLIGVNIFAWLKIILEKRFLRVDYLISICKIVNQNYHKNDEKDIFSSFMLFCFVT